MGVDVLAAAGSILSDAEPAQPQGGFGFLPLLVIGALFIGFMMWSNRRRQKQAQEFRSRLRPGQRVQLYAGLLGNIVTIGEREVFIELAPGVVVSAVPQAVQGIVEDPELEADAEIAESADGDDDASDETDR
ncbi:MAG TPA: preprotein translocase subunit YajC [Beutenbergiaceae bacterium]|nr:preprotein translocase subunit YajC [Beutenbergiaceae bacterium]